MSTPSLGPAAARRLLAMLLARVERDALLLELALSATGPLDPALCRQVAAQLEATTKLAREVGADLARRRG